MRFFITKNSDYVIPADAYALTLFPKHRSSIFSSLNDIWRRINSEEMQPIYEDLFILGLSVFAIDKRMSRKISSDNWTRDISIHIPVSDCDLWFPLSYKIESMLSFLSGDHWSVSFYESSERYALSPIRRDKHIDVSSYDSVCLFSGGLDSFCGAIKLASEGHSMCLLGHNEYPKLRAKQERMATTIATEFHQQQIRFFDFTANARAPVNVDERLQFVENTSRSRSLLFLCAAISIAGIIGENTPVYIPENGFISINVPLTQSRSGSCSTRTTHPFFLESFRGLLSDLGLCHKIINPYQFMTKRQVVESAIESQAFHSEYMNTISCSHPCNPRWKKMPYPKNCGYCYPCIIRKVALMDIENGNNGYSPLPFSSYQDLLSFDNDSGNDLKAICASVHRYINADELEIKRLVLSTGRLSADTLEQHLAVYRNTMSDLATYLRNAFGYEED